MDSRKNTAFEVDNLSDEGGISHEGVLRAVRQLLLAIGEDPTRQGLRETPERVARMYTELLEGYWVDPITMVNDAVFDETYDEMVTRAGYRVL